MRLPPIRTLFCLCIFCVTQEVLKAKDYKYEITYAYPGPLSCMEGENDGWSAVVDAGSLGQGQFGDYIVICAGSSEIIRYNAFKPWV
jgi:hypothetical protein